MRKIIFTQKQLLYSFEATQHRSYIALLILASTSYSALLCLLLLVSEEDVTNQEVGSMLKSTSILGFPGGSLGRLGTGWLCYVIVGLLGHNLDLVV